MNKSPLRLKGREKVNNHSKNNIETSQSINKKEILIISMNSFCSKCFAKASCHEQGKSPNSSQCGRQFTLCATKSTFTTFTKKKSQLSQCWSGRLDLVPRLTPRLEHSDAKKRALRPNPNPTLIPTLLEYSIHFYTFHNYKNSLNKTIPLKTILQSSKIFQTVQDLHRCMKIHPSLDHLRIHHLEDMLQEASDRAIAHLKSRVQKITGL